MSGEDMEVRTEVKKILDRYITDKVKFAAVIACLHQVIKDPDDGPEFVRLMQKWVAVV